MKLIFKLSLLFVLIASVLTSISSAQSQTFSSTAEYRSMLEELRQNPIRPSRMSAGTLRATTAAQVKLNADESATGIRLETDAWRLEITKSRWQLALTNKQTGLTWHLASLGLLTSIQLVERRGNNWRMQARVEGSPGTAVLDLTVLSPTVIHLSMRAPQLGPDSRPGLNFAGEGLFFGLGERFAQAKLDGLKTTLRPEDLLGRAGHNWTYIPVPFLFTPRGLGLYLDTARVSTFDLSQSKQQKFSIQIDHSSLDCYFFVGEPKGILRDYTALTGRTPLPPPWAFGVWICSYQGPQKVLEDARRLRQERIPSSALWVFDVMGKGNIMGWPLWWTGYYPNPRHLTDQLHNMGFKVLTYCYPFVRSVLNPYNLPNPSFEEGAKQGLFVLNAAGKPTGPAFETYVDGNIDFTNPKNVDWWETKIREILLDYNFDGWMEDFGEWVNDTDRFSAGKSGREMANLNPLFYHKITYEIARKAKPDVVEFVRSGYAGSQGYTRVVWGGDQFPNWTPDYGLPSVVNAGITAGLSGFGVWGPDIAGNGLSKELWTRWTEFGALTPIMRDHLWDKPEHAVNLWYDSQTMDTFRCYARLHVSLFPYFYTYAHEAATDGLPIIRHLLLENPDDRNADNAEGEYLLGEKILVAPVLKPGASTRSLYLPKGAWVDYWTGQVIDGGRRVTVPAPLEHIPILVRAGSVLPFISPQTETLAQDLAGGQYGTLTNNLIWRIFPASTSTQDSFTLYDGTVATVRQDASRMNVRVEHSPSVRQCELILPLSRNPRDVKLTGGSVKRLDEAGYRAHNAGWWWNQEDGTLHVLVSQTSFEVNVSR